MADTVTVSLPSSFADAKAFLLQADENGNSLYNHLTDVVLKILEQKPAHALKHFENISSEVKKSKQDVESTSQPVRFASH